MSLEKLLEELIDATNANTKAVEANTETVLGLASAAKGRAAASGDKEDKPKTTRATKPKAVSSKELAEATKAYVDVQDDDEYNERAAFVKRIVKKYGVEKMSEIDDAADRIEAMSLLQIAIAGDDPFPASSGRGRREDVA